MCLVETGVVLGRAGYSKGEESVNVVRERAHTSCAQHFLSERPTLCAFTLHCIIWIVALCKNSRSSNLPSLTILPSRSGHAISKDTSGKQPNQAPALLLPTGKVTTKTITTPDPRLDINRLVTPPTPSSPTSTRTHRLGSAGPH
jgi:hypothetical protein